VPVLCERYDVLKTSVGKDSVLLGYDVMENENYSNFFRKSVKPSFSEPLKKEAASCSEASAHI